MSKSGFKLKTRARALVFGEGCFNSQAAIDLVFSKAVRIPCRPAIDIALRRSLTVYADLGHLAAARLEALVA
jgi:hypothetical protein